MLSRLNVNKLSSFYYWNMDSRDIHCFTCRNLLINSNLIKHRALSLTRHNVGLFILHNNYL